MKQLGALLTYLCLSCYLCYGQSFGFLTLPTNAQEPITAGWIYDDTLVLHRAVDYGAPFGAEVIAAADGWAVGSCETPLIFASKEVSGRFVFIQHDEGFSSLYAHLDSTTLDASAILPCDNLSQQAIQGIGTIIYNGTNYNHQRVQRGQVIGKVGMTGTMVAHLHFEVASNSSGSYDEHIKNKLDPYEIYNVFTFYPPPQSNCANVQTALAYAYLWTNCPPVVPTITISEQLDGSMVAQARSSCDNSCSDVVFGSQTFSSKASATLTSIEVFTSGFGTQSRNPATNTCILKIYNADTGAYLADADRPNPGDGQSGPFAYRGDGCAGDLTFTFHGASVVFQEGTHYRWDFVFEGQNMTTISFLGSLVDSVDGSFSVPPIKNAKFVASGLP